jgi:hypothetical protein
MLNKHIGIGAALAIGASVLLATPTAQAATSGVVHVPSDFVKSLSDTRANGHYDVTPKGGLHIYTDGSTDVGTNGKNSDKVAEYVATTTPLANVNEASLDYSSTTGGAPGFQLVVDLDGNGSNDGILVGEPAHYGQDWWLGSPSQTFDFTDAPGPHDGYDHSDTLGAWSSAYPHATVTAFGFSLGSGVKGDGIINAIDFAGTH